MQYFVSPVLPPQLSSDGARLELTSQYTGTAPENEGTCLTSTSSPVVYRSSVTRSIAADSPHKWTSSAQSPVDAQRGYIALSSSPLSDSSLLEWVKVEPSFTNSLVRNLL